MAPFKSGRSALVRIDGDALEFVTRAGGGDDVTELMPGDDDQFEWEEEMPDEE